MYYNYIIIKKVPVLEIYGVLTELHWGEIKKVAEHKKMYRNKNMRDSWSNKK